MIVVRIISDGYQLMVPGQMVSQIIVADGDGLAATPAVVAGRFPFAGFQVGYGLMLKPVPVMVLILRSESGPVWSMPPQQTKTGGQKFLILIGVVSQWVTPVNQFQNEFLHATSLWIM